MAGEDPDDIFVSTMNAVMSEIVQTGLIDTILRSTFETFFFS